MVRLGVNLILMACFFAQPVWAKQQTVELRKGKVSFSLPGENWNYYKDMLGLPLVIVGPSKSSQRVTISVTATGVNKIKLNPEKLKTEQDTWFSGRKRFVDKFNGKILKKYDYQKRSTKNLDLVHRIGYRYQVEDKIFESYSYYYNCKDQLYHVKSLGEVKLFPEMAKTSDNFLNTLGCQ